MNKLFFAILLLVSAFLYAQENNPQVPGTRATVELVNGAKQNAMFLGVHQDTVSLGGIIQGKFTVVKILRNRFKAIVDEQGNNLLNPMPQADSASVKDTLQDTTAQVAKDSITPLDSSAIPDSTLTDSSSIAAETAAAADSASKQEAVPFLYSVDGKHVFVSLERRSIDSILADQLNSLTARLLQEKGIPVVAAKRTDFGYCREQACIRDSLLHYGAASVFQGSISGAKAQDSLNIQMTHTTFVRDQAKDSTKAADSVHTSKMTLSTFTAMNDAIDKGKLSDFLSQLLGHPIQKNEQPKSYIHVETDPDGAILEMTDRDAICKTPCTFSTMDTGKVTLYAHWSVEKHTWAAKSKVPIIPGDTSKVSLKLSKSKPELLVTSIPEGAAIYEGSTPLSKDSRAIGTSPHKFTIYEPGLATLQLRKEGFRDTLVTFYAAPMDLTTLEVQMTPISDPNDLLKQEEWIKEQRKVFVGHTLMGSSIAPFLIGALFTYLAYEDYNDAKYVKDDLNRSATANGENYQKLVKKNHDLVDKGDTKMIIGGSLLGAGAVLLSIGFALSF